MSRRQQLLARLLIAYREIVDIAPAEAFDRSTFIAKMCSVTRCPSAELVLKIGRKRLRPRRSTQRRGTRETGSRAQSCQGTNPLSREWF
jgi:hypothetical protein